MRICHVTITPLPTLYERIKSEGACLSRGLSAKQIEILQVLASHWHGEGTVTQLASIYAVRLEDLCERPHQVLKPGPVQMRAHSHGLNLTAERPRRELGTLGRGLR